jgi:hypothetical protein
LNIAIIYKTTRKEIENGKIKERDLLPALGFDDGVSMPDDQLAGYQGGYQ